MVQGSPKRRIPVHSEPVKSRYIIKMVVSIKSLFPGTHNDGASQEHTEAVHLFDEIRIFVVNSMVPGYFPSIGPFTEKLYGDVEQEQLEDSGTLDLVKGKRKGRKLGLKQCMGQIKIGEGGNVSGS